MASKLREAEEAQSSLQAECDQYRTILAETVSSRGRGDLREEGPVNREGSKDSQGLNEGRRGGQGVRAGPCRRSLGRRETSWWMVRGLSSVSWVIVMLSTGARAPSAQVLPALLRS